MLSVEALVAVVRNPGTPRFEAQRRDPTHQRTWVALVDGARHQIDCIQAEAQARKIEAPGWPRRVSPN